MSALKLVTQGSPCKHTENGGVFWGLVHLIYFSCPQAKSKKLLFLSTDYKTRFNSHLRCKKPQEIWILSDKCIASSFHWLSIYHPVSYCNFSKKHSSLSCTLFFFWTTGYLPSTSAITDSWNEQKRKKIIFQEDFFAWLKCICFETASGTSIISVIRD